MFIAERNPLSDEGISEYEEKILPFIDDLVNLCHKYKICAYKLEAIATSFTNGKRTGLDAVDIYGLESVAKSVIQAAESNPATINCELIRDYDLPEEAVKRIKKEIDDEIRVGDRVIITKPDKVYESPCWTEMMDGSDGAIDEVSFISDCGNIFLANLDFYYNKKWLTKE